MTERQERHIDLTKRSGEGRLLPVSRRANQSGSAPLPETFLAGGGAQAADSGAILRWGLRRYAWLVLLCIAVVGVLLPMQQLNKKPMYTSEALVVAVDLTADLKTLPRLGEAVFDDGAVRAAVLQRFGDGGDSEDVVPKRASVVTEQDSLVMHVQGHSRDPQVSAEIANLAAGAFTTELNKTGSGVGTFATVSTAVPPVERDEPLRAAPYSIATGMVAGLVMGLGLVILLLVLRRPVVEPAGAAKATDLPVFGTVTFPRSHGPDPIRADEARGLAPVCRQLLDWSPTTVIVTGPDTGGQERHHLAELLGDAFARVRQLNRPPADGSGEDAAGEDRAISVVDGTESVDLIAPGGRSFVVLAVPEGLGVSRVRELARDLTGVPSAIVLVRARGRRRRRPTSSASRRTGGAEERHRAAPTDRPVAPEPAEVSAAVEPAEVSAAVEPAEVPAAGEPAAAGPPAPRRPEPAELTSTADEPAAVIAQPPAAPDPLPGNDVDDVLGWVGENMTAWFPELAGAATLRLDDVVRRARCRLFFVTVRGAGGSRRLVVKQRHRDEALRRGDRFPDRPTLSPELDVDPRSAARIEYQGLRMVHDAETKWPHAAVRPVRPLGLNEDLAAVAMERVEAPLLKDVAGQLPSETSYLPTTPWSNAGAWLRRYHELQPEFAVAGVRTQPEDVRLQLMAYRELLHDALGRSHFVDEVVDKLLTASESLPRDMRLGLSHGDFVAQNTFVHGDGSVSVIDAFPSRRVPVYEDLGRMMVGARLLESSSTRPAYGTPSARPRLHEVALLAAYFGAGNGVPVGRMRFFLALCTLDRWADSLSKQPRSAVRRGLRGSKMTVVNHWYRRELGVQMEMLLPQDRLHRDSWL